MDVLLGLGIGTDTVTDDRIDLQVAPYRVLADKFTVSEDATNPNQVYVTFGMHINGATQNAMLNARNAIVDKLNQAGLGGTAIQSWVTLGVKLASATTMVWWHVIDGMISAPGALRPSGNYIGHAGEPFEVTLRCHRGAFSTPIVDSVAAITGAAPTLYRAAIPGTLPAYVEAVITDTSSGGVVLHGIGAGARSAKDMATGDYVPFQPVTATGDGALEDTTGVADTIAGEMVIATPSSLWSAFCYAQPTEAQMQGRYDLWLRVRDDQDGDRRAQRADHAGVLPHFHGRLSY